MTRVAVRGLEFEVDLAGPEGAPVALLIMGLGMQMTAWPENLLRGLHAGGFRTLIFDQRDTGLSSRVRGKAQPNFLWASIKKRFGLQVRSPYSIADMAEDALAIARDLALPKVHLVGVSMGGMIAQHAAVLGPEQIQSLCLMMSSSGAPELPPANRSVMKAMLQSMPPAGDEEALVERYVRLFTAIGSPAYPTDPAALRSAARASVQRAASPDGTQRHMLAILSDGDRSALLSRIRVPTLVIHGRADALLPFACAEDLARKIDGARLLGIDGMGHDLPEALARKIDGARLLGIDGMGHDLPEALVPALTQSMLAHWTRATTP